MDETSTSRHPDPSALVRPETDVVQDAFHVLEDLLSSPSPEVRRKAAMDILNIKGAAGKQRQIAPPTEEELEYIGRVICETETVRLVSDESKREVGSTSHPL